MRLKRLVLLTPGSFHPTQLPGLLALYDISDLSSLFVERTGASASTPASVDGVVGTVLDLSGNGNHLTAISDDGRARVRSSGGLYRLEFDGVDDGYTAMAVGDLTGASLGIVSQQSEADDDGVIFGIEKTLSERLQFSATGGRNVGLIQNITGSTGIVGYAVNSSRQKTVSFQRWNGATLTTYTNGVLANSGGIGGTIAVNGGAIYLGRSPASGVPFQGDVYVGAIYSRALDTEEQQFLEAWMAGRAGITL